MNAVPAIIAASTAAAAAKPVIVELKQRSKSQSRSRSRPKKGGSGRRGRKSNNSNRSKRGARAVAGPSAFGSTSTDIKQLSAFRKICEDTIGRLGADGVGVTSKQVMSHSRNSLSFIHAHLAQKDTDKQFKNGVRIIASSIDGGSGTFSPYLTIRGGNNTQTSGQALSGGSASASTFFVPLAPGKLSQSLQTLEECFERYAVRYLRLRGRPKIGDFSGNNTPGFAPIVNPDVEIAVGIEKDYDDAIGDTMSFETVAQLETSTVSRLTKAWELEYMHTGTDTYTSNQTSGEDGNIQFQGMIEACFDDNATLGPDNSHPGPIAQHTEVFAIVDFYGLRAPNSQVERGPYSGGMNESEIQLLDRLHQCPRCIGELPEAKDDAAYILTGSEARELERIRKKIGVHYSPLCICKKPTPLTLPKPSPKVRQSVQFASATESVTAAKAAASAPRSSVSK